MTNIIYINNKTGEKTANKEMAIDWFYLQGADITIWDCEKNNGNLRWSHWMRTQMAH